MAQLREVEVTVLSAQDLKNVKRMGGAQDPYCVAWVYPDMKVAGGVNKGGGANPTWNSIITLAVEDGLLEQGAAAVTVDIYHNGKMSNKLIGSATIPLSDVTKGGISQPYQVRSKSGNPHGIINVAMKAGNVLSEAEAAKYAAPAVGVPVASSQYAQRQYYPQQYAQQQYYPQQAAMPRRGGLGGGGLGLLLIPHFHPL